MVVNDSVTIRGIRRCISSAGFADASRLAHHGYSSNTLTSLRIRSNLCKHIRSHPNIRLGCSYLYQRGDGEIRTHDPLLARQVLSQLSYTPILMSNEGIAHNGYRQPPTLPHRLQCSTIGRKGLNHRVRDENGCCPFPHRHR